MVCGHRLLIAEDELLLRVGIADALRKEGWTVDVAKDGEEALKLFGQGLHDVVLTDLVMPGIDGLEVLRRVKRDHPAVEVIILTGHGSDRERKLAEEFGAFAYLQKPVDIDVLARTMREAYQVVDGKNAPRPDTEQGG